MKIIKPITHTILLILLTLNYTSAAIYSGTVVDAQSKKPIADAFVTRGNNVVRTSQNGQFQIDGESDEIGIRAYGHLRRKVNVQPNVAPVALTPFTPKALYLSLFGIGSKKLRDSAFNLIQETELNALVINLKDDMGRVAFKSTTPLATAVGAQKIITVTDLHALADNLHAKGIYVIARIVVFKDDPLVANKPELAIRTASGAIWKDREGLAWCNPYSKIVWNYNIDLAVEAARAGVDEIQFDYVRFPDTHGLVYTMPNTEENRVEAISGFLAEARKRQYYRNNEPE